jgi:hypothetical protein
MMPEDQLLKELGDLARSRQDAERARLDERWDRLAEGTLSADEEAELRALAEFAPEARDAYQAFQPLGADFQSRMVALASTELARGPAPARLLPFRRRARLATWLGSAAAVAAALTFFVLRNPAAPLPVYTAQLTGGDQTVRGGETTPSHGLPVLSPGSLLTLTARPQKAVAGPVETRAFFSPLAGGGELRSWEPRREVSQDGFVRLRGTLGRELPLPSGEWRVWIVVGQPGKIPAAGELAAALRAGRIRNDRWQAMSADLRVDDHAPP